MARVALFAVIAFAIDQASKAYVLYWLRLREVGTFEVFPPFLVFRMAWNEGINFGLFADFDARWALVSLAIAIVVGLLIWVWRTPMPPIAQIAAGLMVGGALGNVIERVFYGAVVDFLNMSCCGIQNPFSFNIADAAVFLGVLGLVIWAPSGQSKTE